MKDIDHASMMTVWEKFCFLALPISWTLILVEFLLANAFGFVALAIGLLFHPHLLRTNPHLFKQSVISLLLFAALCAIPAAILIFPVRFFRKMRDRKRTTGASFPGGEELARIRYRRKHPPAWMKVLLVTFFSLTAFSVTLGMVIHPHPRSYADWIVPGLFWLVAIMVVIEAISTREGRRWTGFVVAGAFGGLAILATIAALSHGNHKAWFWPITFAVLSGFAFAATGDGQKQFD